MHILLQSCITLSSTGANITFYIDIRNDLLDLETYDENSAFMNQMFLFGEIFQVMLFILAMIALCLRTRPAMYYMIIMFGDIVIESAMLTVATILYYRIAGSMFTLILVAFSGGFSMIACLGEMILSCCEACEEKEKKANKPTLPFSRRR